MHFPIRTRVVDVPPALARPPFGRASDFRVGTVDEGDGALRAASLRRAIADTPSTGNGGITLAIPPTGVPGDSITVTDAAGVP